MFTDAEDEDSVVAHRGQARLPALLAPALFGLQMEVIERCQRAQGAEDLAGDMEDRLAVLLSGRDDLERVVVEAEDRVILRLSSTDIARKIIGAMDRSEPLFPLRQLRVEQWLEGRLGGVGEGAEAEQ